VAHFSLPRFEWVGWHHADGSWHTLSRSVIYAAEHPALAMVEVLAHMRLSLANIPSTLQLIRIEVAPGALIGSSQALPVGRQANEPTSQAMGIRWLDAGVEFLLPVPSALIPHASNYLVNTAHPQAQTHLVESIEPFWFDKRYLR
jgi:RES domain-containing protein